MTGSRNRFADRVVLVTGAARGIGWSIAESFAAEGAVVVIADRDAEAAELAADRLQKRGGRAIGVEVDIAEVALIDRMVARAIQEYGRIDVLVNNAAHARFGFALDVTEEEWDYTQAICARGTFFCTQRVARTMSTRDAGDRGGAIVNVSSMTVPLGHARNVTYSSAKGSVETMTRVLAVELAEYGIRVNAVAPGPVETEFSLQALTRERREARLARMPAGRLGRPADVASAVLFLSSEEADWVTGSTLAVDGGYTAHGYSEMRGASASTMDH
ncbi:glucose 1-dehydrogenase [Salinibacterium sp. ZJ454]|uniref:SDR family NAD(P)-dependent oxidoreductase n=1 Tax=Salinibacterium sp. ZJ454 TaxID=2708339 RepID=UPI00141DB7AF|nr:glucose 1-dehydrogenase [Salinibacterium sp. ZJ454]